MSDGMHPDGVVLPQVAAEASDGGAGARCPEVHPLSRAAQLNPAQERRRREAERPQSTYAVRRMQLRTAACRLEDLPPRWLPDKAP